MRINYGLKTKIYGAFGIIILLFLVFGLWAFYSIGKLDDYQSMRNSVSGLKQHILNARKAEKDFQLYEKTNTEFISGGDSQYQENFQSQLQQINENATQLQEHLPDFEEQFLQFFTATELYESSFNSLSDKIKERGFKDLGLEGKLRADIHSIENSSANYDKSLMLSLRRHEKDFLLRNDMSYVSKFNQAISVFKSNVNDSIMSLTEEEDPSQYESILTSINSYQANFGLLVALSETIGFDKNTGLQGQISASADALMPLTEEFEASLEQKLKASTNAMLLSLGLFFLVIITVCIGFSVYFARSLTSNINKIKEVITQLGKGEYPDEAKVDTRDELYEMETAINKLIIGLKDKTVFAKDIGEGKYDNPFEPLSEEDILGNALIEMRGNLKKIAEDEKQRNWDTEGLAKFGDILRADANNVDVLADNIIGNLIDYMDANQGGLFILNDDDENEVFMELTACYAWNRKKYLNMKVKPGEGLAGQCWQEQKSIFLKEVPDSYIKISSGLGKSNPKSVLIVPLKVNEEVFGVVELASFNLFKDYQVEFLEKLAENIASTLSSVKVNAKTKLLLEQSQQQAEEMRAQEEEMRQNQEELTATQEEMIRQKSELEEEMMQLKQEMEQLKNSKIDFSSQEVDPDETEDKVSSEEPKQNKSDQ